MKLVQSLGNDGKWRGVVLEAEWMFWDTCDQQIS